MPWLDLFVLNEESCDSLEVRTLFLLIGPLEPGSSLVVGKD